MSLYKVTNCIKCGRDNKSGPICQSSQLCLSCHYDEERRKRMSDNKFYNTHCPKCNSTNYCIGIYHEICYECGYEEGY